MPAAMSSRHSRMSVCAHGSHGIVPSLLLALLIIQPIKQTAPELAEAGKVPTSLSLYTTGK